MSSTTKQPPNLRFVIAVALFALLCALINPGGFIGGPGDDKLYHEAALCWVDSGAVCMPQDHWSSRWPVIAPLAAGIALLGDTRAAMAIGPSLYWAAALVMVGALGREWISRDAGRVGVAIMAATPILTSQALQPTADIPEFAFQLAALLAATNAYRLQSGRWAMAAGVAAGLAFEVRETSALFIAVSALAWLTLDRPRRKILLLAIPALIVTIGIEMMVYWVITGDPLRRYILAFGHVAITTAELPAGFDTTQSPLFNRAYIAEWKRERGIEWAWPLDPWLNLLASFRIGVTLWAAIIAALVYRQVLAPDLRRRTAMIGLGAVLVSMLLVYGLGLDPKSRLFLLLAGASAIIAGGYLGAALRRANNLLAVTLLGMILAISLTLVFMSPSIAPLEAAAGRWIVRYGALMETDPTTREYLIFVPGAKTLPPLGSNRPLRLTVTLSSCAEKAAKIARLEQVQTLVVAQAARAYPKAGQFELCLLKVSPTRD